MPDKNYFYRKIDERYLFSIHFSLHMIQLLSEGFRIFKRKLHVSKHGFKKYPGNADQICKANINDCWNGKYFQVSAGHFREFYIRDLGWCIDSLLKLGYKDKVLKTLSYALDIYSKQRLTTTITPSEKCIDIFDYAPDSLAYLLRCLHVAKAKNFVNKYSEFLNNEIKRFNKIVVDQKTKLVKQRYFSSMKDSSNRKSSCYDNVMVGVVSKHANNLKLDNPLKNIDSAKLIKKNFWNNEYFFDDLRKLPIVTGDSAIAPFWFDIIDDNEMLKKSIDSVRKAGLDIPFPLKYSAKPIKYMLLKTRLFVPNYQSHSIKMNIGPMYVQVVKRIDKELAKSYKEKYKQVIEKYGTFLEVYNKDGTPYKTMFYTTDEAMLWAGNYLTI